MNKNAAICTRRTAAPLLGHGLAILATLCIAGFIYRDALRPGLFIPAYDIYAHKYLMWEWGWRQFLAHGTLPEWNPYLFGGFPFIASFAFCPYYFPAWLFVLLPTGLAITTQFALSLFIGGMGFYATGRALRLRPGVAILSALLYEAGSHVVTLSNAGHINKVEAIAWLPWAFAASVLFVRTGRKRWAVALGAAWAMQLLASHSQIFYATFLLTGSFVGIACLDRLRRKRPLPAVRFGLLAIVIAGALSAIQMFPAWNLAQISNRAEGVGWETASFGSLPTEELLEVALPTFRGDSTGTLRLQNAEKPLPYVGRWHGTAEPLSGHRIVSDYVGVWVAVFALVGLCISRRRMRWTLLALLVLFALFSIGSATPFFKWCYAYLPGFSRFRSPGTWMLGVHFTLCLLGMFGLEAAVRVLRDNKAAIVCGMGAAVCGLFWFLCRDTGQTVANISEVQAALLRIAFRHVLAALAAGLLCASAWVFLRTKNARAAFIVALLFASVALLDLTTHIERFIPVRDETGLRQYLYAHPMEDTILQHAQGAALPGEMDWGNVLSSRMMMRGVRSVHGYHPVVYAAYEDFVRSCAPEGTEHLPLENTGAFESEKLLRHFAINYRSHPASLDTPEGWQVLRQMGDKNLLARTEPIPFAHTPNTPNARVDVTLENPNMLRLRLVGADRAECILALPAVPGWNVMRGTNIEEPGAANAYFQKVLLEANQDTLLVYRAPGAMLGRYVTLGAILALLVVGLLHYRRRA